jgi:hypothetical protein
MARPAHKSVNLDLHLLPITPEDIHEMKYADGVAALERADRNLAPLLTAYDADDEVFRALPHDTSKAGTNSVDDLIDGYQYLYLDYSASAKQRQLKMVGGATVGTISSASLLYVGQPAFGNEMVTATEKMYAAALLFGMMGVVCGAGFFLILALISVQRRSRIAQGWVAYVDNADLSGLVEVVNPDEATALALDRAKAHTMTAQGPALARARQHYYDLLVEVANGTAGTASGAREDQWRDAWTRWCAVDDTWTDLLCDPLAALSHAELLDVTLPRTGAFVTAYAEVREMMTGRTAATVPADLSRLIRAVNEVDTAWTEAREHAEHVGYAWLPEAERKIAAKAEKALTLAADTSIAIEERANAAQTAARLLGQIKTVRLPKKARAELEHLSRKALPVGTSDAIGTVSEPVLAQGPILVPADPARPVESAILSGGRT